MRLIAVEMGRVIHRFVPEEVRSTRGLYIPEVIRLFGERYSFGVLPTTAQSIQGQGGARFQQGRLVSGDRTVVISDLGLHNDAIAVTTTLSTDDAEFVLQDVLNWARQALGMREQITNFPRVYESHLVVEFDRSVEDALDMYVPVTQTFGAALKELYKTEAAPRFSRITFSLEDAASTPPLVRNDLWIERRAGAPYSQNRYFSACGVQTAQHQKILETFETVSKKRKK